MMKLKVTINLNFKYYVICVVLLAICGCCTPLTLQSEDYVIHRIQKGESPDQLAERFLKDKDKVWIIEEANPGATLKPNKLVVIPLKDRNKAGLYKDGYQVVPILCYHQFKKDSKSSLSMPPAVFESQMKYLKDSGYRTISSKQLRDYLEFKASVPRRSVMITIDDGYRSVYDNAYPILKKYGYTAIVCVYTDFVSACANSITWSQLQEMASDGFEIASHTLSHSNLTKLKKGETDRDYMERVRKELVESKKIIDHKLNQNTTIIAYPFGLYNQKVIDICHEAGYTLGFSVKSGFNPFFANTFYLHRNQILERDLAYFKTRIITLNKMDL